MFERDAFGEGSLDAWSRVVDDFVGQVVLRVPYRLKSAIEIAARAQKESVTAYLSGSLRQAAMGILTPLPSAPREEIADDRVSVMLHESESRLLKVIADRAKLPMTAYILGSVQARMADEKRSAEAAEKREAKKLKRGNEAIGRKLQEEGLDRKESYSIIRLLEHREED